MIRSADVVKSIAVLLLCAGIITGCGSEEVSNIDTGMTAIEELNYTGALEAFAAATEAGEDERLILRGQGMVYMAQLQYEEAIDAFVKALNLSDGVPEELDYDINYYLAAAYYKSGRLDEARAVYDAILTLRPDEFNAYYLRGVVELESGDFDSANTDFHTAIDLNKGDNDMVVDIYQILAAQGYKEAGREIISECIASDSGISDYDYGRFEYYLGNYESAKNYLEQADKGDQAQITLFLGRTYESLGDYNYAISLYNTYLDKNHNSPNIYNQMGLCQMKMERYAEALSSFQAGMNTEDKSILQTLKYNEAIAYEYMHEFDTASSLMREYISLYPDDTAAQREYEFLQTR
ncbi:MAG: tetratricopeptide repeat protein [Lachnospiraceae bacterium]|nr:tetratricopeptide repeat protein [Lachnospiraceae bacterium]